MILGPRSVSNPNATINIHHPEHYCAQCEHRFSSKPAFLYHLRAVHNMNVSL